MPNCARKARVIIAGAGPAGLATALYLLSLRPDLAGEIVALERQRHPRPKICAGGLLPRALYALDELGLGLPVPARISRRGRALTEIGAVEVAPDPFFLKVVRRDEFDAFLARAARAAGLVIMEDTAVRSALETPSHVEVTTTRGVIRGEVLVGADGSGSRVRSSLFGNRKAALGRALMTDLPVDILDHDQAEEDLCRFDFRCVADGIHGYAWSFPCLIQGQPHLNIGIYDQVLTGKAGSDTAVARLTKSLMRLFPELQPAIASLGPSVFKVFPIRWYDGDQSFVGARTLLVGDAAGVDPLMGEGISTAFEQGRAAARAIARFLDGDRGALTGYDRELHEGAVGRKLARLNFAARHFYGRNHRFWFRLASLSRTAQQVGVDWYNGVGGLDRLATPVLIWRWLRWAIAGVPYRLG